MNPLILRSTHPSKYLFTSSCSKSFLFLDSPEIDINILQLLVSYKVFLFQSKELWIELRCNLLLNVEFLRIVCSKWTGFTRVPKVWLHLLTKIIHIQEYSLKVVWINITDLNFVQCLEWVSFLRLVFDKSEAYGRDAFTSHSILVGQKLVKGFICLFR